MNLAFDLDAHRGELHDLVVQGNMFTIRPCCHLHFSGTISDTSLETIKGRDGVIDLDYYLQADVTDLMRVLYVLKIPFSVY